MEQIIVMNLKSDDYIGVRHVDELTQQKYLGEIWEKLSEKEKEKHLKSRKSEFNININTRYSFVAESDGVIVGFIFVHENLPFEDELMVRHLAVHPNYQGKGVGVKLYQTLIEKGLNENKRAINAWINVDNPRSIRLHKKIGFDVKDWKRAILVLGK